MAKVEARLITASSDVKALVDKGFEVNTQYDNLGAEDKAIKAKIKEFVESKIEKNESNVSVAGTKAQAVVTAVESYELNKASESFEAVKKHSSDGEFLSSAVKKQTSLSVAPSEIEKAVKILKASGVGVLVAETYKVDAKGFRAMRDSETLSSEEKELRSALVKCAKRDVSYRLTYEKLEEKE